tara:strand:- start:370 stop:672 length:303 start_codon:yes stop_codon:yes gene_type:complete
LALAVVVVVLALIVVVLESERLEQVAQILFLVLLRQPLEAQVLLKLAQELLGVQEAVEVIVTTPILQVTRVLQGKDLLAVMVQRLAASIQAEAEAEEHPQ